MPIDFSGKVYYIHTEAKEAYGQVFLISGRQEVTFKVRTCTSASVLLVGGMDDLFRDTLEIIIGAYTTKVNHLCVHVYNYGWIVAL